MNHEIERATKQDVSRREPASRRKRLAFIIGGVVGAVALTGGIALALWDATGSGFGSAKARTAVALTITAAVSPTADLYPGGSGALQFTVTNTNPYSVTLTNFATSTITSGDQTNCAASNVSATTSGTLGASIVVGANATSTAQSLAGLVQMGGGAPNLCQGVTFTITMTLTGAQT